MKREDSIMNISFLMILEGKSICDECGKEEIVGGTDEYELAEAFYENGWRADDNYVYCKKCRKILNKKK